MMYNIYLPCIRENHWAFEYTKVEFVYKYAWKEKYRPCMQNNMNFDLQICQIKRLQIHFNNNK